MEPAFTPEIGQQVRRIQLATGRQVADVLAGAYLSVFRGRGMEFDEVRPYVPGDDVRTIDWNVTARMGAPYVKRYVEERELTVMLLVDVSASQGFGSAHRSKREAAAELSALLAFSAIHNDDKVGLLRFHGDIDRFIPPRKGQKHALRVVRDVLARGDDVGPTEEASLPARLRVALRRLRLRRRGQPPRGTDIGHAIEFCQRVMTRRAVLFLITDFLDEGYLRVLQRANRKHDVVAVLVSDERERALEDAGLLVLRDAETGAQQLVDTRSASFRARFREHAEARIARIEQDLRASRIDLIRIDPARPVLEPLLAFLRMRNKRYRR